MRKWSAYAVLLVGVIMPGLPTSGWAQGRPASESPIRLQRASFFPSRGEPTLPAGLRLTGLDPGVRGTYIVQFAGPIEEAWKQTVTAAGGELLEYIPDFAFKVRMTPAQAQAARRLPQVRWVGFFHPAYKLNPRLRRGGERMYTVRLENGTDGAAVAKAIAAAGAGVSSRDGSILLVSADENHLDALARILDVAWIEDFELHEKHNEYAGQIMGAPTAWATGVGYDGSTQTVAVADTGLGGGTAATAHADIPASRITGIFNWPGAPSPFCYQVTDDLAQDVDSGHGTHVAGSVLGHGDSPLSPFPPGGRGVGTAPGARLVFQAVENWTHFVISCLGNPDGYYLIGIPSDIRTLFQQAYTAGARVHSNSWGSGITGAYTIDSRNADDYVWNHRDATVTFSAGNAGVDANADGTVELRSLAAQASAKNVLTVGASENDRASDYACDTFLTGCSGPSGQNAIFTYGAAWPTAFPAPPLSTDLSAGNAEQMAPFSSRGPTSDGRIKPDVVAPGTWVLSTYSDLYQEGYDPAVNPKNGLYQYDGWGFPLNSLYKYMGGTSMSSPLVAGGAAVVRDYYQKAHDHSASAALVKATLINSAVDLLDEVNYGANNNSLPIPNMYEGWGRVNLAAAVDGSRAFRDEGPTVSTGGALTYTYSVAAGTPLKISLVWTDRPAATSAVTFLVNDLNLDVSSPDGVPYRGNAFAVGSKGWTVPNSGAPDRANNVENVYVQSPAAGNWTITVRGYNVPMGPQNFALVVAGQSVQAVYALTVTAPTHGTVTSEDGYILCGTAGSSCSRSYLEGTKVFLDATPDAGYVLSGWTGDCTANGACNVTMDRARAVGATFAPAPTPSLTISDATVTEGNCGTKNLTFTVTLGPGSPVNVAVSYETQDNGSAVAGQDYVRISDGNLVFDPWQTSRTIAVKILSDTTWEGDETFNLKLTGATYGIINKGTGVGTILNDDPDPSTGVEGVVWTNTVGVNVCGPDLTKTAAGGWGNAGAASTREIDGNGYAEFGVPTSGVGYAMFGLSGVDTDAGYASIDYAFYTYPATGQLLVYEKGSPRAAVSFAAEDKLRVSLASGVVTYWRNGVLLYTSNQAPTSRLRVDTSLYSTGAVIQGAVLFGTLVDAPTIPVETVLWTNVVGVTASPGNLTKTAVAGWGNAGAASTREIDGNGYAEFTVPTSGVGYAMFGLSSIDSGAGYASIDYALYTYPATGQLLVYEKGSPRLAVSFAAEDKLRVSLASGVVTYWRNGVLLYTSNQAPTSRLRVDTSLYSTGAVIQGAVLFGTLVDAPTIPVETVLWTNVVGVTASPGNLTKTAVAGWGNAGAASTREIDGSGYAEFTVPTSGVGYAMFGLSGIDTDAGYTSIDYAFYTYPATGQLLVYEKGSPRLAVSFAAEDKLRVSLASGVVTYWRNGVLLYLSSQTATSRLRVDTSLYSTGALIQGAALSGTLVDAPD